MALSESWPKTVSPRDPELVAPPEVSRTVIWLRGDQDFSNAAVLSETMNRAITVDEADVVIDLSEVRFMGAATIGAIVQARELLRARARTLALRAPSARTQRVVELCGLAELVDGAPRSLPESA